MMVRRRKQRKSQKKFQICLLICVMLIAQCIMPVRVRAEGEYKTIKVGYYQAPGFQDGDGKNIVRSGYGYEYLQKIASYTGWKYEYVSGNWGDLYEKLKSGEIDLLAGVSYDETRSKEVMYPDYDMLKETFFIYKDSNDTSMQSGKISSYDGKKIGVVDDSKMTTCLEKWKEENHANVTTMAYQDLESCAKAFNAHEIDGFVSADNIVSGYTGISPVEMIGKLPYYVCVAPGEKDVLEHLNTALSLINGQDSSFITELKNKYSADTSISIFLSKQEKEWLETHKEIKVGYLKHYLPYCDTGKNGKAEGVLKDVLTDIFKNLPGNYDPDISYIAYGSQDDLVQALKQKKVDIIFPVGGELPYAEENEFQQSSVVLKAAVDLVYIGNYQNDTTKKIAVNKNNELQYEFTKTNYPDAKIIACNSIEECIRAVKKGKANSTLIESLRAVKLVGEDSKLCMIPVENYCDFCFGVNYGNSDLLCVLNHGISMLGEEYGRSHSYQYMGDIVSYNMKDFIRTHIWIVYVILGLCVAFIICILLIRYRLMKKMSAEEVRYNKILQEALVKEKRANYAKHVFLNNMSHDIRTPLNAICGLIEINQKSEDRERIQENRKKAKASVEQLLTMMDNMIEMSQLESGELLNLREAVDMNQIIRDVKKNIIDYAESAGVELVHESTIGQSDWPLVYSNASCIRDMLQHILDNAVKYNHTGGKVFWKDVMEQKSDDQIEYVCTIADTGQGMNEEFIQHIFEPFAQEKYDARTTYKGTGLGMAIVKTIIDQMNGWIKIESEEEKGTTILIKIPLEIVKEEKVEDIALANEQEVELNLSGKKILLVEDNELNIEIAQFMLEDAGASVIVATDGEQAVNAYKREPSGTFDAVLMDIMMPVMNGYEAAKAIRSSRREDSRHLPIIATTACATEEAKIECIDAGMDAFMEKPLDMSKLIQILMKMTKR